MNRLVHRFPKHGTLGLVGLLLMMTALFCAQTNVLPGFPWHRITGWTTPVCWWSYLLLLDAWIYRRKGASLLTAFRSRFALMCILSVAFWCLFEAYNRLLPGWRYINLESNLAVRFVGHAVSFATIMPGLFLTCELLQSYRLFESARLPGARWSAARLRISAVLGAAFCFLPPFLPAAWRGYLWGFVWTGWILLLEPVNYRRGAPSLYRDWERGDWSRTLQLAAAGAICGLLWEFWNYWAYTKWVYVFPAMGSWRYFEMPLIGFLGFPPFALEYFVLFHFLASFFTREDRLGV
jgi:hypothetical protein